MGTNGIKQKLRTAVQGMMRCFTGKNSLAALQKTKKSASKPVPTGHKPKKLSTGELVRTVEAELNRLPTSQGADEQQTVEALEVTRAASKALYEKLHPLSISSVSNSDVSKELADLGKGVAAGK